MLAMRDAAAVKREIVAIKMRDGGNALRPIQVIKMRDANNVLRSVFSALTASASPIGVSGYAASAGPTGVATNQATATPLGGLGPFTYVWTQVGGTGWTIQSPTAATTGFVSPSIGPNASEYAQFQCTVTDASGATATTNLVSADAYNIGSGMSGTIEP